MAHPSRPHVDLYAVDNLPEPPANFQLMATTDDTLLSRWRLEEWQALLVYHGLGYEYDISEKARRKDYLRILKRILYHKYGDQTNYTLHTLGDVGPGALPGPLRQAHNIPDHYLTQNAAQALLQPAVHLRESAAFRPKARGKKPLILHVDATILDWLHADTPVPESAGDTLTGSTSRATQTATTQFESVIYPAISQTPEPQSRYLAIDAGNQTESLAGDGEPVEPTQGVKVLAPNQATISPNAAQAQTSDPLDFFASHVSGFLSHVEKALIEELVSRVNVRVDGTLRILPAASSVNLGSCYNAINAQEARKQIISTKRACSTVSLKITEPWWYSFDASGSRYHLYGHGPIWNNNSCAWDSIIVAMRLFNTMLGVEYDAPCLRVDQHAFQDMLLVDWTRMGRESSIAERDNFVRLYAQEYSRRNGGGNSYNSGGLQSVLRLWEDITEGLGIFAFSRRIINDECPCGNTKQRIKRASRVESIVPSVRDNAEPIDMQRLIQDYFRRTTQCPSCRQTQQRTRILSQSELPEQLVIALPEGVKALRHTGQLDFTYDEILPNDPDPSSDGDTDQHRQLTQETVETVQRSVTYQWLGGIYLKDIPCGNRTVPHFTVFWDDQSGENRFIHYDGLKADGAIVGGLSTSDSATDRVPANWTVQNPPLLFYKRVLKDKDPRDAAKGLVEKMTTSVAQHLWRSNASNVQRGLEPVGRTVKFSRAKIVTAAEANGLLRKEVPRHDEITGTNPQPTQLASALAVEQPQRPLSQQAVLGIGGSSALGTIDLTDDEDEAPDHTLFNSNFTFDPSGRTAGHPTQTHGFLPQLATIPESSIRSTIQPSHSQAAYRGGFVDLDTPSPPTHRGVTSAIQTVSTTATTETIDLLSSSPSEGQLNPPPTIVDPRSPPPAPLPTLPSSGFYVPPLAPHDSLFSSSSSSPSPSNNPNPGLGLNLDISSPRGSKRSHSQLDESDPQNPRQSSSKHEEEEEQQQKNDDEGNEAEAEAEGKDEDTKRYSPRPRTQ